MGGSAYEAALGILRAKLRAAPASAVFHTNDLAAEAGVSRGTMLRAVSQLAEDGLLHTRRHVGVVLRSPANTGHRTASAPVRLRTRAEGVAARIITDIESGTFARNTPLPPSKALASRYGVSLPTLRSTLRGLVSGGVLRTDRRWVIPVTLGPLRGHPSVLFAIPGWPNQVATQHDFRHEDNINAFEQVCSRQGLIARRINVYYDDSGERVMSPALDACGGTNILDTCLGLCINQRGLNRDDHHQLLAFAAQHRLPVALLDESDTLGDLPKSYPHVRLRVFGMGNTAVPGETVSRLLTQLGHRRVAYLFPSTNPVWSQRRLRGLVSALEARPGAVTVLECPVEVMPQERREGFAEQGRIIARTLTEGADSEGWRYAETPDAVRDVLFKAAEGAWLHRQVHGILKPWVSRCPVTAAVGANDSLALACMGACRSLGIDVPRDLSVVGFDDTPEAARNGCTSYSFDSLSAAQAMLNFILEPLRRPYPSRPRVAVVQTQGRVSVRLSTGRPGGGGEAGGSRQDIGRRA